MSALAPVDVGHTTAQRIYDALREAEGPLTQHDLAAQLGISRSRVCESLAPLREHDLVETSYNPRNPVEQQLTARDPTTETTHVRD